MNRIAALMLAAALLSGCAPSRQKASLNELAEEFVYTSLANAPVAATQIGYHQHGDVLLDERFDDYSPSAIEGQRRWLQDLRLRLLSSVRPTDLDPDSLADYQIMQDQIALGLLELQDIQKYRHNPTLYVELVGNGLYSPYVLRYADAPTRFRHIIGRLNRIPALLAQARRNLTAAPELWTKVAQEENEGNIGLIERTLRVDCPAELRPEYDAAAATAVRELRHFNQWLNASTLRRTADWRLGSTLYAEKFRLVLATDTTPEQVLAAAEEAMRRTRAEMYELAKTVPGVPPGDPAQHAVIRRALTHIARRHATPQTYFSDARRDLAEVRAFVQSSGLVTLPPRDNLEVIETPEFMRGIYAVGGFSPAPALEPHLGAFYWLTPIPPDWAAERIESKLREYNYYGLKLLTIHEAMPGHYVQLEYANSIEPQLRRLFRAVFGNGPYIEGWAVYATEAMLNAGYLNHDPALRLTFLKQQLRVFANAILDIRLQTLGMTDEDAIRLMVNDAFQEREEAEAKLQRAKLSSTQLPTYFVGWRDWRRLLDLHRRETSAGFSLRDFHDRALQAGAVPVPVLARLLTGKSL